MASTNLTSLVSSSLEAANKAKEGEFLGKDDPAKRFVIGQAGVNFVFTSGKTVCAVDGTYSTSDPKEIKDLEGFPEYSEEFAPLIQDSLQNFEAAIQVTNTTK